MYKRRSSLDSWSSINQVTCLPADVPLSSQARHYHLSSEWLAAALPTLLARTSLCMLLVADVKPIDDNTAHAAPQAVVAPARRASAPAAPARTRRDIRTRKYALARYRPGVNVARNLAPSQAPEA